MPWQDATLNCYIIRASTIRAGKPLTLIVKNNVAHRAAVRAINVYLYAVGAHFLIFRRSCHFHSLVLRIQLSLSFFANDYFDSFFLHNNVFRSWLLDGLVIPRQSTHQASVRERRSTFGLLQFFFLPEPDFRFGTQRSGEVQALYAARRAAPKGLQDSAQGFNPWEPSK
jgi:hypothetical protein